MTVINTIKRAIGFRTLGERRDDAVEQLKNLAMSSGRLPCPQCGDTGPHQDNDGRGDSLAFRCRACRSFFKMSEYDWKWAWRQPRVSKMPE